MCFSLAVVFYNFVKNTHTQELLRFVVLIFPMIYRLTVYCYYHTVGMSMLFVSSIPHNNLLSPGRGSVLDETRLDSKNVSCGMTLKGSMFCWKTRCHIMSKCWLLLCPVTSHGSFFFWISLSHTHARTHLWKQEAGLRLLAVISLTLLGPRLKTQRLTEEIPLKPKGEKKAAGCADKVITFVEINLMTDVTSLMSLLEYCFSDVSFYVLGACHFLPYSYFAAWNSHNSVLNYLKINHNF